MRPPTAAPGACWQHVFGQTATAPGHGETEMTSTGRGAYHPVLVTPAVTVRVTVARGETMAGQDALAPGRRLSTGGSSSS